MPLQIFTVRTNEAGQTLAAVLRGRLGLSWSATHKLITSGQVFVNHKLCPDIARRLQAGMQLSVGAAKREGSVRESSRRQISKKSHQPDTSGILIVYSDEDLLIVDKPIGWTTSRNREEAAEFGRGKKYLPPTLEEVLPRIVGGDVIAVHRLDRDTTGLIAFARNTRSAQHLGRQFRIHSAGREYIALVRGELSDQRIESYFVRDRGDGRRGSTSVHPPPDNAERAVTHIRVCQSFPGYTLVECRLETGRTHQVRIHLGEKGTPICGERIYDRPLHGAPYPDGSGATRPLLHAVRLKLVHPATDKVMVWESPWPADLRAALARVQEMTRTLDSKSGQLDAEPGAGPAM